VESIRPIRPAAAYIGGKRRLAERIVRLIDRIPHTTYTEPFVGMGGVFLRRGRRPSVEIVNDLNRDVATFFRILQRHYPQFMDTLKFQISGRAAFERLVATDPDTLTDLERAARFLYLQSLSFGGKVSGRTFGVDPTTPGRFNIHDLAPRLDALHDRLAGVIIECLSYSEFIGRYDRSGTLFYCDPPYWGSEGYYMKGSFTKTDFRQLAEILAAIQGSFILSINDCPEIRQIFAAFKIEPVSTVYSVSGGSAKTAPELLITGGAGYSLEPDGLL